MSRIGDSGENQLISQLGGFLRDRIPRHPSVGTVTRMGIRAVNLKLNETGTLLKDIEVIGGMGGIGVGSTVKILYFADNRIVALNSGNSNVGASGGSSGSSTAATSSSAADYVQNTYTTGTISLGTSTDGAWVDVDAANMQATITPVSAGKYLAIFRFSVFTSGTAVDEFFRITDGTTSSHAIEHNITAIVGNYTISYVFNWAASIQTVKLQKEVVAATALASNVINIGTAGDIVEAPDMQLIRIGS